MSDNDPLGLIMDEFESAPDGNAAPVIPVHQEELGELKKPEVDDDFVSMVKSALDTINSIGSAQAQEVAALQPTEQDKAVQEANETLKKFAPIPGRKPPVPELESNIVPEFAKAGIFGIIGKDAGANFTLDNDSFGEDTLHVLRQAHNNSGEATSVGYKDYPDTARGLPTRLFMHENLTEEERKQVEEVYGGFTGVFRMLHDMMTDPVIQAALSVGGWSKKKGEFDIDERWNFNTQNKTAGDSYALLRNLVGRFVPIGDESKGPKVSLKLFDTDE